MESGVQRVGIIQRSRNPGQFSLTLRIFFFKIRIPPGHIYQETVKQGCSAKKQIGQVAKKQTKGTNQHLPSPNQIPAAEAALDSNASETELFLGQKHPATSADQPFHQPMPDDKNK
jgi:dissimilatory sulfite reductase (desulfoviridin) alpha/beta subunit